MAETDGSLDRFVDDPFLPARKEAQKLRLAIDGPSGSGKTFSALIAASVLADAERATNPDMRGVAVIDTEHGSAALYADQFEFNHVNLSPPYSPARYISLIRAAAEYGYSVCVIDSLSHGWNAEGGVIDIVDNAQARTGGNKFAAWKEGTPAQNALILAMLTSPMHIIATMRTAQEWILEEGERGTKTPRRVGMKPVQRDGVEYEFTIVADMDLSHKLVVSKSRARPIADRVVIQPGPAFFTEVLDWLRDGTPMARPFQLEQIGALRDRIAARDDLREQHRAWWMERRFRLAHLSEEEAAATIAHLGELAALLDEPPVAGDATTPPSPATAEPITAPGAVISPPVILQGDDPEYRFPHAVGVADGPDGPAATIAPPGPSDAADDAVADDSDTGAGPPGRRTRKAAV